jgi:hypothetical protein
VTSRPRAWVVTTADGSYWYFSNGDGTWRELYIRTDLPL